MNKLLLVNKFAAFDVKPRQSHLVQSLLCGAVDRDLRVTLSGFTKHITETRHALQG